MTDRESHAPALVARAAQPRAAVSQRPHARGAGDGGRAGSVDRAANGGPA